MATPSSTDMTNADEWPRREKTHIDGGAIGIAVLDDYQHAALSLADWSSLKPWASITVFHDHLAEADAVVARLKPFDVVCVMRERTPLTRDILQRLPGLKLIASTAPRNASIDKVRSRFDRRHVQDVGASRFAREHVRNRSSRAS